MVTDSTATVWGERQSRQRAQPLRRASERPVPGICAKGKEAQRLLEQSEAGMGSRRLGVGF